MGRLNHVARTLALAGGAFGTVYLVLNGGGITWLFVASSGVVVIGGVLMVVDGELKKRRER